MKFKTGLIVILLTTVLGVGISQRTIQLDNEEVYLKDLNKSASDFKNQEDKLLYFIDNLEKSDYTHQIAEQISGIKNKSPKLQDALKKKIIISFLKFEELDFRRITSGIFNGSSNLMIEFLPFLQEIVQEDSPYRQKTYIESLPTFEKEMESSIFKLEDKLQILAYKEILKIDPENVDAFQFFSNYPRAKPSKAYKYLFRVKANRWSGAGLMNEFGEWILPPIYDLPIFQKLVKDGVILVNLARSFYPSSKLPSTASNIYSYGNWIDSTGIYLLDKAIPNASAFNEGVAKCFDSKNPKYINTEGKFVEVLSGVKQTIFNNKYSVTYEKENTVIRDDKKNIVATLDKKYTYVNYHLEDDLFTYGHSGKYHQERYYGYLDSDGNILTKADFYTSVDYSFATKSFEDRAVMVLFKDPYSYGLVNRKFETLIPFEYQSLRIINDKYIIGKKEDDYHLFNLNGEKLDHFPEHFKSSQIYYRGDVGLAYSDNNLHLINLEGEEINFFKEFEAIDYKFDKAILKHDDKLGIINKKNIEVLPFSYDDIYLLNPTVAIVKTNDTFTAIDLISKKVTSFPEGYLLKKNGTLANSDFVQFEYKGKLGIVNTKNEVIIPFLFENIRLGK